jgi:hypothetical protein
MKTSKLILISVIMAIAFMGYSVAQTASDNVQTTQKHNIIKVHVNEVMATPGLYEAITNQVSPDFLQFYHPGFYAFKVKYHSQAYYVYGQYKDWRTFFSGEVNIGGH